MSKQEIITEIQNGLDRYFVMYVTKEKEKKFLSDICCMLESLREPETLAEFLGWEENVEYVIENRIGKYRIKNNELQLKVNNETEWGSNYVYLRDIDILRNAKKVKPKKYYLKHKWMVNEEYNYLNGSNNNRFYFLSDKNAPFLCKTQFTEKEIEEIKKKYSTNLEDFEIIEVED